MAANKREETQTLELLSEAQSRAALLLATGATGRSVATQLGVHPSTLSQWRQTPEFRAKVNEILADAQAAISHRLTNAAGIALDVLIRVMTSETASDRDKLAACAQVLGLTNPSQPSPGPTTPAAVAEADAANEAHAALWAGLV